MLTTSTSYSSGLEELLACFTSPFQALLVRCLFTKDTSTWYSLHLAGKGNTGQLYLSRCFNTTRRFETRTNPVLCISLFFYYIPLLSTLLCQFFAFCA